nr:lysozyme inhibitor LprI family protein [Achromobacter xylosoxidans]
MEQTQKAWLAYRNGHCALAGAHVGSPMYEYCPMLLNINRADELRELAGD